MTRKEAPESARDMWWAQEQTSGNVKAVYENVKNEPEEGALHSTEVSVRPSKYDDVIEVRKELWYYGRSEDGRSGWPLRMEVEWSREMTFEEFRASEWWELYLGSTKNLNFDSSWMDSLRVDDQSEKGYSETTFVLPVYEKVWWCSSEVPTGGTTQYSVYVCEDGTIGITRGKEPTVERNVDEILESVRFAERAHKIGLSISEDGKTIMIERGDRDAD